MNPALRLSARSSVSLGLACLALCFACSSSSSDGGSAGTGGSDSSHAGAASGGTSSGGAGGGNAAGTTAGGSNSAGASSGGTSSAGTSAGGTTSAGTGGKPGGAGAGGSCNIPECLIANTCVDKCGGMVVYTGCCACVPPAVDKFDCGGSSNQ